MRPYLDSTRANVDAMGNTLRTACYYLKDPNLVRAIQERLGVKQIIPLHTQTADGTADAGDVPAVSVSHDLSVSAINGHGDNLGWLSTKVKRRKRLKPPGSSAISPPSSPESEDSKLPDIIVETLPVLDIFFRLATELGYEPFYITFLPFFVWNIDTYMTRHVIIMWIWSMYLGQACKALFQWKRPSSPPAIRLENNPSLETEYGFPSTHAIVSTTIPFYLAYCAYFRYKLPLWVGLPVASFWCGSVCLSRLYLGVHTPLDILGGLCIAVLMLALCIPGISLFDWLVFDFDYTLIAIPMLIVFLLYIYPVDPHKWTMDRGDTAAILGAGFGVLVSFHVYGRFPDDLDPGPFEVALPSLQLVGVSIVRFVVGVLLLLPTRFIMKLLCFRLLPGIMPTHGVQEVVKRPLVELPYKIITYGMIGFNSVYLVTHVFEICNISR